MIIRFSFAIVSLMMLIVLSSCGPDYNTDFDPPPPDAKLTDVFPEEIGGMKGIVQRADLKSTALGFSSTYGEERIVINVIQTKSKDAADEYFKTAFVPIFDKMKNHFRGSINGKWRASGTDETGRKWYGWVNNNWVFLINGSDDKYFKMGIDAFKYIKE